MSDPSRSTFTDADLDRLESLICTPDMEGVLMPDAMQGLFCAVASSPAPIPRERWMPAVLGEDVNFASAQEAAEITGLIERFHAETVRRLASGEGLDLLFYPGEEGEEEEDLAGWSEGYLIGVGLSDPDWFAAGEEEVIEDLLFPFMALSGRLKEYTLEAGEPWHSPEAEEEMMAEARERIGDDIVDAYNYWFEQRIVRVPVKREDAKVGRNDPCPCGSGKKFKNCCGAA